jgi:hypothetical protein
MTLRSISAHRRIEFGRKPILFVGDLGPLSPQFSFSQYLSSIVPSQAFLIGHQFENFRLQQQMRDQDPMWNGVLLSIVDGQTHSI